jgi:4-hydroxy-tetrahydrodipicolinate reductase
VGTTGLSEETLKELEALIAADRCLFIAPNFAIGAVLLMQAVAQIAPHMPDAEIIELHHDHKLDAPSGTALRTADLIAKARSVAHSDYAPTALGAESEMPGCEGARGAKVKDTPIHSVRLPGYVAHQEVIFGGLSQTLTLRHDSSHRSSFMPGVVLACEQVTHHSGLIVGLEHFLEV